jgi:integrase
MQFTLRQRTDKPDKLGRCYLFADVTWPGQRATLPTGVKCLPAHFSPGKTQPISTKDLDSALLNTRLTNLRAKITKVVAKAEADEVPLTVDMLRAALPAKASTTKKTAAPAQLVTPADFHAVWLQENPSQNAESTRRYKQAVTNLEAYQAGWPITQLTRADFLAYLAHTATLGLVDSTVQRHVKFIRECFRLAGLPVPTWLKLQVRYGRSPALQDRELRQLIDLPLFEQDALEKERDLFLFQTLLLLRDSDLRQVRPHHVSEMRLPGVGNVPVLSLRQVKTGDEVRLPLPPMAVAIWAKYEGNLPVSVQQYRNRHMKLLMERANLTRPFVRVRYVRGEAIEEVVPLWQVVTTHTARHTGADMIMLGSGGDTNLKEKVLGHAGVYGHDTLERYGPLFLAAWESLLSNPKTDNKKPTTSQRKTVSPAAPKRTVLSIGNYNSPKLT